MTRQTKTTPWRKSSHSNSQGNCVELAGHLIEGENVMGVRDSKQGEAGDVLIFSRKAFTQFLHSIRV